MLDEKDDKELSTSQVEVLSEETHPKIKISPPRSPWLVFILNYSTFGLYAGVWLLLRVSELKKITGNQYTPWLWLFTPFIGLAQIFSFPRFFRTIKQIEEKYHLDVRRNWVVLWIIAVVIATHFTFRVDDNEIFTPINFIAFLIWCLLFAILQGVVNSYKEVLKNVEFTAIKKGFSSIEWLIVICLFPLVSWVHYEVSIAPLLIKELKTYQKGEAFHSETENLSVSFYSQGWTQVPISTFSDEDETGVVAEFKFLGINNYIVIWDQGLDASMTNISRYRQKEFKKEYSDSKCLEMRKFSQDFNNIKGITQCSVIDTFDNRNEQFSIMIKSKDRYYELYGYFELSKEQHNKYFKEIKKTVTEFKSL